MTMTAQPTYPIERVLDRVASKPEVLAALRRGVGRSLDEAPSAWPYVIEAAGDIRWREEAAHVTLGLFALHQQSKQPGSMNQKEWGLGRACRTLKYRRSTRGSSEDGVERRFRAALSSDSLTSLAVHLRGLVTLLRGEDIPLDYSRLFWDLSSWRNVGRRDRVALRWAREYFKVTSEEDKEGSE